MFLLLTVRVSLKQAIPKRIKICSFLRSGRQLWENNKITNLNQAKSRKGLNLKIKTFHKLVEHLLTIILKCQICQLYQMLESFIIRWQKSKDCVIADSISLRDPRLWKCGSIIIKFHVQIILIMLNIKFNHRLNRRNLKDLTMMMKKFCMILRKRV